MTEASPADSRAAHAAAVSRLEVVVGDITRASVDAIVNAANEALAGGGGVDGAIHRAAGADELARACRALPEVRPGVRCPTGEARITPGFRLPARYIIHTVGPVWQGGHRHEAELLAACYTNSIELARTHRLATLAFPAISTGVFGYPLDAACQVAVHALAGALGREPSVASVSLFAFSEPTARALRAALADALAWNPGVNVGIRPT
jgi:O-acetyl-ADP-ribose deacetylase (regulator of RNase III)